MGDIKRKRRLYVKPRKLFDSQRIREENIIVRDFGLKNKREIWKAKSVATKLRQRAKKLIGQSDEDKQMFIEKLHKLGLKVENISDVLALNEKDILERRLQTIVFRKKLTNTPKQARQLIVHKCIIVNGNISNTPSFWVTPELESKIEVRPQKEKIKKEAEAPEEAADDNAEAEE